MNTLIIVTHVITCVFIIVLVLLQSGKGADAGATFGGFGQTYFGTQGGNILTKITTVLAFLFMLTSIGLTIYQHKQATKSVMSDVVSTAPVAAPTPANTNEPKKNN